MLNAQSVGPGGGGALFDPRISPRSNNTIFVACDLSGLYRTDNGGESWTMIDKSAAAGSNRFSVAFHPTDDKILAFHPLNGFMLGTHDPDAGFAPLAPMTLTYMGSSPMADACTTTGWSQQSAMAPTAPTVTAAAWCPDAPGCFLVGTDHGIARFDPATPPPATNLSWCYPSTAGKPYPDYTYTAGDIPTNGADVLRFVVIRDPNNPGKWLYVAATACEILQSPDSGKTWRRIDAPLPTRAIGGYQTGPIADNDAGPDPAYRPSRIRGFAGGSGGGGFAIFATLSIVDTTSLAAARIGAISLLLDRGRGKAVQPELHGGAVTLMVHTGVPEPGDSDIIATPRVPGGDLGSDPYEMTSRAPPTYRIDNAEPVTAAAAQGNARGMEPAQELPEPSPLEAEALAMKQHRDADQDRALGLKVEWGR